MNRYSSYKDSGVEWIGEIPEHWSVKKITHLFSQVGSGTTPKSNFTEYYENGEFNWLQTGDLTDGFISETSKKITNRAVSECNMKFYKKGSLVVAMYGATIGKTGILQIETATNQACCVLAEPISVKTKFIHYWFALNKQNIISLGYGGGQPNISQDIIKSLRVQYPPLQEQEQIVSYLDKKTAIVDTLITSKEEKINLLKENRTALINHAITKGLNPNVEFKDSGVEWIGEIPKHWDVKKLKHLTLIISKGTTPSTVGREISDEGEIRYLKAENIKENEVTSIPAFYIDLETNESIKRSTLLEGDILFVIAGATIGKVAILKKEMIPANTNQAISFIRLNNLQNRKYIWYWLSSSKIQEQMWVVAVQSAQPNLSMENLGNFQIPYPLIIEQEQIVEYLDTHTQEINELISLEQKKIETLKEYRQALISEVVTGKIKVVKD